MPATPNNGNLPTRSYQSSGYTPAEIKVPGTNMQQVQVQSPVMRPAPVITGDPSWRDSLLANLLGQGAKIANKAAELEFAQAYLEGAAQAGIAKSEEELNTEPLTKDWTVAGYRDTLGKLSLTQIQAKFLEDLPELRKRSPEELQDYLAKQREQVMPLLQSMSREARASVTGQLATIEQTAIRHYTTEHAKYIVDQKVQAIQGVVGTSLSALKQLQDRVGAGDATLDDYTTQLRSTAVQIIGSIWKDPSLPDEVKQKLVAESIQLALQQDQVALYDYLAANSITGEEDKGSVLSRLPLQEQNKLAGQYREAMQRTSDMRNLYRMNQLADLQAQIDSGQYQGTFDELQSFLNPMVQNGVISGERRASIIQKYLEKRYESERNSDAARAYLQGDIRGLSSLGMSLDDGLRATEQIMLKQGLTPEQQFIVWSKAALAGSPGALRKAGEIASVSLQQMRSPDFKMLPQHVEMFQTLNNVLQTAKNTGNTHVQAELLSALPERDRVFTQRILSLMQEGNTLEYARQRALDLEAKEQQTPAAVRVAQSAAKAQELNSYIDSIEPRGIFSTIGLYLRSPFSEQAQQELKLRAFDPFAADANSTWYSQIVRESLRDEVNSIITAHPELSSEDALAAARANVLSRTIETKYGPVVLPKGATVEQTLGVPSAQISLVPKALEEMYKPTKEDSTWRFLFTNGRLYAQEVDKAGVPVGAGTWVEPEAIRSKVDELVQQRIKKADEVHGEGKLVAIPDTGGAIRVNGKNTAGVPEQWMYEFRRNLIKHEGVRGTAYPDLSGAKDKDGNPINVVGVGIASHTPYFPELKDGKASPEDIERSFMQASNDAANSGYKMALSIGRANPAAFQLFAEIAYQSGLNWHNMQGKAGQAYNAFLSAMQAGDKESAKRYFKMTPAYVFSGPTNDLTKQTVRRHHYLRLIDQALGD